ncbi:MAG: V-type ATP synthase subunit D [Synergistaceae bacterium]|nr:V-type ATP synthase subunit D [Synergistaceae bacterium]
MKGRASGPPTREHLLATRKRIGGVTYGKKLLERKRDALLRSAEEERRLYREVRSEFLLRSRNITFLYSLVRMFEGDGSVRFLSAGIAPLPVAVEKKSIMGCRYSVFSPGEGERKNLSWKIPYDPAITSLYVEDLLKAMADGEECMWQYINLKTKITAIERELARTTLKINTLEHILLPSLLKETKRIEDVLSERERQEKFVAKRMGKKKRKSSVENMEIILDTICENHYS